MRDKNIYKTSDNKWYWRDEVGEPSDEHDYITTAQQELDEYYIKFEEDQNSQGLKSKVLKKARDKYLRDNIKPLKKLTPTQIVTCTIIALASLVFVGALIARLLEVVS